MIKEAYCSYEVAKLLKEKGFDEPCTELNKLCIKDDEKPVLKITQQKAMKWLREVHNIDICVFPCQTGYILYSYTVKIYKDKEIYLTITDFETYEEAVEMAIKYSLKNLI